MDKINISKEIKEIIEKNPIALSTITPDNNPNIIAVAYVKVVNGNQILVTDNYMKQTIKDIKNNPNVAIAAWNKYMVGYKLLGQAKYITQGKLIAQAKLIPENKGMPVKGVVLIKINRIIKSA